jgi:hypothetical protein
LHAFNASGTEIVAIKTDGTATIIGTTSTAYDSLGRHIRLGLDNTNAPVLEFTPKTSSTATDYASMGQLLSDDLGIYLQSGLLTSTDQKLGVLISNGSAGIGFIQQTGNDTSTSKSLFALYGTTSGFARGAIFYGAPTISSTGLVNNRGSIANGSYTFVTTTYGPTMVGVPAPIFMMDLGGTTAETSVGFVSTTSLRHYSSSWTSATSGTVFIYYWGSPYA